MKKNTTILLLVLMLVAFAQTTQTLNYKAVVNNVIIEVPSSQ